MKNSKQGTRNLFPGLLGMIITVFYEIFFWKNVNEMDMNFCIKWINDDDEQKDGDLMMKCLFEV